MMVQAGLTIDTQNKFWAEAVLCSSYLEDLTLKAGRTKCALETWTNEDASRWFTKLVEFGRIGVVNKRHKNACLCFQFKVKTCKLLCMDQE